MPDDEARAVAAAVLLSGEMTYLYINKMDGHKMTLKPLSATPLVAGLLVAMVLPLSSAQAQDAEEEFRATRHCQGCELSQVDLSAENWVLVDLAGAVLRDVDISSATLSMAIFDGAELDGVSFREARLQGATFEDAILRNVDFHDADLTGARFTGADMDESQLAGAQMCNTTMPDGVTIINSGC